MPSWRSFVTEAAQRFDLPEAWIMAVIQAESKGQTELDGLPITSPAGAIGLMQVMPATYAEMRVRHGLGADPYAPHDNILAGTAYLKEMAERYGYPFCFAAYNAGPGRLEAYLQQGRALPAETISYLANIETALDSGVKRSISYAEKAVTIPPNSNRMAAKSPLFFVLGGADLNAMPAQKSLPQTLFVPLGSASMKAASRPPQ
ncbi:MAG TPA: lytic transglycosylase domain-containing protein [Dongiaceae bacterium]|nr:lytic transglycosylase domain-containing protein [Dongiaceae bacterium]